MQTEGYSLPPANYFIKLSHLQSHLLIPLLIFINLFHLQSIYLPSPFVETIFSSIFVFLHFTCTHYDVIKVIYYWYHLFSYYSHIYLIYLISLNYYVAACPIKNIRTSLISYFFRYNYFYQMHLWNLIIDWTLNWNFRYIKKESKQYQS